MIRTVFSIIVIAYFGRIIANDDTISTPIKFGGQTFEISFPAEVAGAVMMAKRFCDEKASIVNIDSSDLNELCIRPIGKLLVDILEKKQAEKKNISSKSNNGVVLDIQGERYVIPNFIPGKDSPFEIAKSFCIENMATFQINEETLDKCIQPVKSRLEDVSLNTISSPNESIETAGQLNPLAKKKDPIHTVDISFDGSRSYSISLKLKQETVGSVAKKFCVKYREELGIRFSDIKVKCVDIVEQAFASSMDR